MRYLILITLLLTWTFAFAFEDCCNVIHVDKKRGIVTVINKDTGESLQYSTNSKARLSSLRVGGPFNDQLTCVNPGTPEEDCWNLISRSQPEHTGTGAPAVKPISPTPSGILQTGDPSGIVATRAVQLADGIALRNATLKRRGSRALKLEFSVTNDTGSAVDLSEYGMVKDFVQLTRISLVDIDAGKRYEVVTDDRGTCVCSRGLGMFKVGAGATKTFWAHFPAPPSDVTMLTLEIPGGVPVEDIPIQ